MSFVNKFRAEFEAILVVHTELAELDWLERNRKILKGKLAYRNYQYSYEGGVYAREHHRKGPITNQERVALKKVAGEISQLDQQIEGHELKALIEADPSAFENARVESHVRELRDEMDGIEELSIDSEGKEVMCALDGKLKQLLQTEMQERGDRN